MCCVFEQFGHEARLLEYFTFSPLVQGYPWAIHQANRKENGIP